MGIKTENMYTGVCLVGKPGKKKWWARARLHGEEIDLGYFDSQHLAAYELCKARIEVEHRVMAIAASEAIKEQQERGNKDKEIFDARQKQKALNEQARKPEWCSNNIAEYAFRNPGL